MITESLQTLFLSYMSAFAEKNLAKVRTCYHLPCILTTPDKTLFVEDESAFIKEFKGIFDLLSAENITGFKASNASYQLLGDDLYLVNIDWQFLQKNEQVFTEFTAQYQVREQSSKLAVYSVQSVDSSQSLSLANPLTLNKES